MLNESDKVAVELGFADEVDMLNEIDQLCEPLAEEMMWGLEAVGLVERAKYLVFWAGGLVPVDISREDAMSILHRIDRVRVHFVDLGDGHPGAYLMQEV